MHSHLLGGTQRLGPVPSCVGADGWLVGINRASGQMRSGRSTANGKRRRATPSGLAKSAASANPAVSVATAGFSDGCSLVAPDELREELRRVLPSAAFPAGVLSLVMEYRETQLMFARTGGVVHIFDVWAGLEVATIELNIESVSMCLLSGRTWLATGASKHLDFWDYVTMRRVKQFELAQPIRCLCWIPKHRVLAVAIKGRFALYDVCAAGSLCMRQRMSETVIDMQVLPCGDRIAVTAECKEPTRCRLVILPVTRGPRLFTSEAYSRVYYSQKNSLCGSAWGVVPRDNDYTTIWKLPSDGVYSADTFAAGRLERPRGSSNALGFSESAGAVVGQPSHTQLILASTRELVLCDLASPRESSEETARNSSEEWWYRVNIQSCYDCRTVALDADVGMLLLAYPYLWRIQPDLFVIGGTGGRCFVVQLHLGAAGSTPESSTASAGAGESASCAASVPLPVSARLVRAFSVPCGHFVCCECFSRV